MKIALVQRSVSKDSKDNIDQGLLALEEAASNGANLVAFPELAFTNFLPQRPFTPDAIQFAEPIPGPTTQLFCHNHVLNHL